MNTGERLPVELRKNKCDYKLIKRTDKVAIYAQLTKGCEVEAYEVFIVKWKRGAVINGLTIKPGEKFPSNADFGKTAWACSTLERAEMRFLEFENQLKNKYENNYLTKRGDG